MTMERGAPLEMHPDDVPIIGAYITDEVMQAILDRQCHRCAGCNAPLAAGSTHFDLRQPAICGGAHTVGNFEALCPFCHRNLMHRIRERLAGMNNHRDK